MDWIMRRGQIKHLLYEHCLNGRITKTILKEQFEALNEAEPVKHGRWEQPFKNTGNYDFRCSECKKYRFHNGEMAHKYHYCPNCGAKMDLDEVE